MNEEQAIKGPEDPKTQRRKDTFKNLREAVAYLRGEGWKISQSTLYKHQREGKIKTEPDGSYTQKAILRYAKGYLTTQETKRKLADEELQRRKTKAEIQRNEELAKSARIKRMAQEGLYVLRADFDLELAARAAVLENGLKFAVQTYAGEWVEVVGGDHGRTGDLIQSMNDAIDRTLNEYSNLREFHVLFKIKNAIDQDLR